MKTSAKALLATVLKMGGPCPQCRGRLVYDPTLRELVCTSCGQVIVFEERLIAKKYAEYGRIGTPRHRRVLYSRKAGKAVEKQRRRRTNEKMERNDQ